MERTLNSFIIRSYTRWMVEHFPIVCPVICNSLLFSNAFLFTSFPKSLKRSLILVQGKEKKEKTVDNSASSRRKMFWVTYWAADFNYASLRTKNIVTGREQNLWSKTFLGVYCLSFGFCCCCLIVWFFFKRSNGVSDKYLIILVLAFDMK